MMFGGVRVGAGWLFILLLQHGFALIFSIYGMRLRRAVQCSVADRTLVPRHLDIFFAWCHGQDGVGVCESC